MTAVTLPGLDGVAYAHLLLVGWICLTIMGAITQFVPVWSGIAIHSRRLAVAQLWLVTGGVIAFVLVLLAGRFEYLPLAALPLVIGIWTFVYNVGRTMARARPLDVTEGHFAAALTAFAFLALLGYALAVDFTAPVFDAVSVTSGSAVTRGSVYMAHVTLALFGAILLSVVGALYQLAKMFTGSSLSNLDRGLIRFESATLPPGVFLLALGRGSSRRPSRWSAASPSSSGWTRSSSSSRDCSIGRPSIEAR